MSEVTTSRLSSTGFTWLLLIVSKCSTFSKPGCLLFQGFSTVVELTRQEEVEE